MSFITTEFISHTTDMPWLYLSQIGTICNNGADKWLYKSLKSAIWDGVELKIAWEKSGRDAVIKIKPWT